MIPRLSILIIDEDADDIELFVDALYKIDKSIISKTASTTEEALQILSNDKPLPDWIFIDLEMKRSMGMPFLRQIRSTPAFSQIPIVIYSASLSRMNEQQITVLDDIRFLPKPFEFKILCDTLTDIIHPQKNENSSSGFASA